jgi:phage FluMu protein Com
MPRTVQCQHCGVVLNLPPTVRAGKKLKCPKCQAKFAVTESEANSASTFPGLADATPMSTHDLPRRGSPRDELPLPQAAGDLRETFDLPLLARDAERGQVASSPEVGDAAALFDDPGPNRRKQTAADARRQARRCRQCGGLVPQGMSICSTCGVDQETGMRVGLEDDLAPPPRAAAEGPPFHIAMVGGLCTAAALSLLVLAIVKSVDRSTSSMQNLAWLGLAVVSGFAVYAAAQFIRGKSLKLLVVALTLGVVVDVMSLVALPIFEAMLEDEQKIVSVVNPSDPADMDKAIKPFEDRIDTQRIKLGVGLILVYAVVAVYLMSPTVKRYFRFKEWQTTP